MSRDGVRYRGRKIKPNTRSAKQQRSSGSVEDCVTEALRQLKTLHDKRLITQAEYERKKRQYLDRL